jgi:hypothetical protein
MKPPIIKVPDPAPGSGGGMDFQVRLPDKLTETAVPVAAVFFCGRRQKSMKPPIIKVPENGGPCGRRFFATLRRIMICRFDPDHGVAPATDEQSVISETQTWRSP